MMPVQRFYFLGLVTFFLFVGEVCTSQVIKLDRSGAEQPVKEEIRIRYSNLPAISGNQFYTLFIFGSGGSYFHDSRPLQALPSGTVRMNPLQQPGAFDIVLYRYNDFNDNKPQQVARLPFKAVVPKNESSLPAAPAPKTEVKTPPQKAEVKPAPPKPAPATSPATTRTSEGGKSASPSLKVPAKPEPDSVETSGRYAIKPAKNYNTEEEIVFEYSLPPLGQGQFYSIAFCRPSDTYTINISNPIYSASGKLTLKPIYQDGIYEFRVYLGTENKSDKEKIVYRQPVTVGSVKKDFSGRYNCKDDEPKIFGKAASGAPTVKQVLDLLHASVAPQHTPTWLQPDDVCLEFFSLQFLSPSSVRVRSGNRTSTFSSFPVKARYKIAVNDFVKGKSEIREEGVDKVYHFYRNSSRNWAVTAMPAR